MIGRRLMRVAPSYESQLELSFLLPAVKAQIMFFPGRKTSGQKREVGCKDRKVRK